MNRNQQVVMWSLIRCWIICYELSGHVIFCSSWGYISILLIWFPSLVTKTLAAALTGWNILRNTLQQCILSHPMRRCILRNITRNILRNTLEQCIPPSPSWDASDDQCSSISDHIRVFFPIATRSVDELQHYVAAQEPEEEVVRPNHPKPTLKKSTTTSRKHAATQGNPKLASLKEKAAHKNPPPGNRQQQYS